MKKLLMILLPLLICGFTFMKGEKIFPYKIHQQKLQNGLNIVTVPFDSPGIAALYIVVRVGSRNEIEEGVTGFAHFFEHMMFRGTDKYPKEKYDEVLKSIGASANAYTSIDQTVYHMVGNSAKLELMFEVEGDRFQNLHYSEHDFKTEAGAVKGEYTKNISNPSSQLYEDIRNTAYDKHTYKHTTMGFLKDIVDMPNQYAYSMKFFDRFYRPEYCTVLVTGDVTPEQVMKLSEKYFGNWKKGSYTVDIPVEPPQNGTRVTHIKNGDTPPVLSLNFKGPGYSDADIDSPALDLISSIYFSSVSEIYNKLVVTERKIRNVRFGTPFSRDPNLITVSATLKNKDDMQYVKDEIMKTLEKIKTTKADEKKFADAISETKYSFAMGNDTPGGIAGMLAYYIALSGDPESVNNYYSLYDKITPDDLMNIAKKYFIESALTIGTISADDTCPVK
jgi:zinc protease